jgi:ubiquinone/menaquinone biosynthesis C-methylase UbiE
VTKDPQKPVADPSHYSYAVYADVEMAGAFDQLRFSGPIGTLVAESQERVLIEFAGAIAGQKVIDVGTGTGRGAIILARGGACVTGVDASEQMLDVARQRSSGESRDITWRRGDAHRLDFPDRAFEVGVSLRVLMHTPIWRQCLGELCRVSRRRVVFDYPALSSAAVLQAAWRRMVALTGRQVEAYRVFATGTMSRELARHGFRVVATHRQFVLPIALHKAVGSRRFTEVAERGLALVGLVRLFGSPVTVAAERVE